MQTQRNIVARLVMLVSLFTAVGCADRGYWYLSIVNGGPAPVEVSVSSAKGAWTIAPGGAKTVKIDGQKDSDSNKERTFTLKSGDKVETLTAPVHHPDIKILDITGTSCIVAADYGAQYRPKEIKLPEGEPSIRVIQTLKGQRIHTVSRVPSRKSKEGAFVDLNIGDPLPETLKLPQGYSEIPEYVRLTNVPCDVTSNAGALYKYLNDH